MINTEIRIEQMKKFNILVATHNIATRCAIINSLAPLNTQYYYVKNESEVLDIISDVSFDMIIFDSTLSGTDGIDFCRLLKGQKNHSKYSCYYY